MEDEHPGREANKICGVCGDRALGYNFNAVSCESCKAFFRRNALKNKDFRCPFTENCEITIVTRRFCQKCRLDKCFAIGMRKEYIMSEEDKVLKRQKIEQNRAKKRPQLENSKLSKIKRESVEDGNLDNDTTMSVASATSTVSETYIWESDRKYTDLDAGRQLVIDNMSPVTAASVPSPSSPPESANIAGSKTLEMLKESKFDHNPGTSFDKYNQHISRYDQSGMNFKENISSQTRFEDVSSSNRKFDGTSQSSSHIESTSLNSAQFEQNLLSFGSSFDNSISSPSLDPRLDGNSSDSLKFEQRSEQQKNFLECMSNPRLELESCVSLNVQPSEQMNSDETTSCQKTKETCSNVSGLVLKFIQDPNLIAKFLSEPNLVAKIFQDQNLFTKIMTDPETVTRLMSDPQVSQFLKENDATSARADHSSAKNEIEFNKTLANNGISDNMIRHMLGAEQNQIENPILTNLITNRNPEEHKNEGKGFGTNSDSSNMEDVTKDVLQNVQRIPIAANSIESILCEAIKLEFSAYSTIGGNQSSRELNDAERAKLNELIVANKALLAPLDDDISSLVGEECRFKENSGQSDPVLLDVINLTAIAIRRLIKMSKKINAFKNMCQEDQLALLKGGCTEMMILRSALNYDSDKNMWKIPYSQEKMSKIKVDVLKEAKGNLYTEHAKFVRTFDPRWRDENIILILSAIALFTPDRPRVVHSDVIKLEQNSYYYLLRRYLESVYPGCEAKSTFLKLIQKISELHRLNDEVVGVYLNVNPSSVEPLLIEIFDLKH